MNYCGVYVIRCEPTGSQYVGASVHIVKRIREHFYQLVKGVHRNRRLHHAFNKYGKASFRSDVVLNCDPNNLEMYGKKIIKKYRPEFNIVNSGHAKGEMIRNFRAVEKTLEKQMRIINKLEKTLKRTHRS
jgi:group I intron endonuclease